MVCFSPKQGNDVSRVAAWQDKAEGFQCEAEESVNNSPRFSRFRSPEPDLIRAPKYHLSKAPSLHPHLQTSYLCSVLFFTEKSSTLSSFKVILMSVWWPGSKLVTFYLRKEH